MAIRTNAIGNVQFIMDADIPDSWGTGLTWADPAGTYDPATNTVNFSATTDFPTPDSKPADDPFTTYSFKHIINVDKIPANLGDVKIVIQGKNGAAGVKKTGTVTNSVPILKR
jgi:hypothetical protein